MRMLTLTHIIWTLSRRFPVLWQDKGYILVLDFLSSGIGEVKISKETNFPKLFGYINPALYFDMICQFGTIVQEGSTPLMGTSDPSGYGFWNF